MIKKANSAKNMFNKDVIDENMFEKNLFDKNMFDKNAFSQNNKLKVLKLIKIIWQKNIRLKSKS